MTLKISPWRKVELKAGRFQPRLSPLFCLFSGTLFLTGLILLLMSSIFSSCQRLPAPARVILLTLDTQRADHLSYVNASLAQTPHLDELARAGVYFNHAYSLIPITLPSHASLFFSQPPYKIKNYNNGQEIKRKRARPSFVNLFKKNGFKTAAFVSLGVLASLFGLDEGFDTYEDSFPEDRWYLHAGEVNERVFPWLEAHRQEPFFLWLHYSDPHDPYAPPDSPDDLRLYFNDQLILQTCLNKYRTHRLSLELKPGLNRLYLEVDNFADSNPDHFLARLDLLQVIDAATKAEIRADLTRGWYIRRQDNVFFFKSGSVVEIENGPTPRKVFFVFRGKLLLPVDVTARQYRAEVEYMDSEIGRLVDRLKELNLYENTLFVVVGDHGEGLGEYQNIFGDPHIGHIHFLYDVYLRIPFIITYPGHLASGQKNETPVTLLDVAPTILAIMGWERLPQQLGRSVLKLKKAEIPPLYFETYRPEAVRDRFAIFQLPWSLIITPEDRRLEVFNLAQDPLEKNDLSADVENNVEVERLKKLLEDFARTALKEKEDIVIDKKTEEMLRSLGYIR